MGAGVNTRGGIKTGESSPSAGGDRRSDSAPGKICIAVLGMHRSGTSAFARVMNLLGCSLPADLMPPSESNATGHWESASVASLNDEILTSAGSRWDDWMPFSEDWYASPVRDGYRDRALGVLNAEFGASPLFVVKDPRICRIAPFWFDVLTHFGCEVVVAMPIRNPFEVAQSLQKRDGLDIGFGLLLWLRHVLEAEHASRGRARHIFAYDQLLADWARVSRAMEEATGLVWPRKTVLAAAEVDGFLTRDARHQNVEEALPLGHRSPLWVRQTYTILKRWCELGEDPADYAALDQVRAEFDVAAPSFGLILLHHAEVETGETQRADDQDAATAALEQLRAEIEASQQIQQALQLALNESNEARQGLIERLELAERRPDLADVEQLQRALAESQAALKTVGEELRGERAIATSLRTDVDALSNRLITERTAAQNREQSLQEEMDRLSEAAAASAADAALREVLQSALNESNAARQALLEQLEAAEAQQRDAAQQSHSEQAEAVKALEAALHESDAARRALLEQLEAAEARHRADAQRTQLDLAQAEAALEAARHGLEGERAAATRLRDDIAALEGLRREERRSAQGREQGLLGEMARMSSELGRVAAGAAEREALLQSLRGEIVTLENKVAEMASALLQRKEEAAQAWAEVALEQRSQALLRSALDHAEAERATLRDAVNRLTEELGSQARAMLDAQSRQLHAEWEAQQSASRATALQEQLAERERALVTLSGQVSDAGARAARYEREMASLVQLQQQLEQHMRSTIDAVRAEQAEAAQVQVEAAQVRAETALEQVEAVQGQAKWLTDFVTFNRRLPRWIWLVPLGMRRRFIRARAERTGMIDYSAYYAANPDVAQAGWDALDHYAHHGIFEGRTW